MLVFPFPPSPVYSHLPPFIPPPPSIPSPSIPAPPSPAGRQAVLPFLGGRPARRLGDPWPPPDLRGRHAGEDHPGDSSAGGKADSDQEKT